MQTQRSDAWNWAQAWFGDAELGDSRRAARLVKVVARAAERPSGKLSEVFSGKELDAAYDFVENEHVRIEQLESVVGLATASQCRGQRVRVAVDGSSLSLTRRTGRVKGFGPVGSIKGGMQGLKVIGALAMTDDGVPIGLLSQAWWARPFAARRTLKQTKKDRMKKKPAEKETARWLEVIERSAERLEDQGSHGWFQLDREADAWPTLCSLASSGHWFTVRACWDRRLAVGGERQYLRARMASTAPVGDYEFDVTERYGRQARRARMMIHVASLTLLLREKQNGKKERPLPLHVVWTHEVGTTPAGEKPLNWMLLTNAPIDSLQDARDVVGGYTMRWRIEEFHRAWKSGICDVECTQLRSRNAVVRWATILGVVAARAERIKRLSREAPERPASDELTEVEIEVLLALKRTIKKRREIIPNDMPTMAQAALWLADIGGYTGKSSGGPPGAITIGRGLERVRHGAKAVLALRN